jgi:hypothetical protein
VQDAIQAEQCNVVKMKAPAIMLLLLSFVVTCAASAVAQQQRSTSGWRFAEDMCPSEDSQAPHAALQLLQSNARLQDLQRTLLLPVPVPFSSESHLPQSAASSSDRTLLTSGALVSAGPTGPHFQLIQRIRNLGKSSDAAEESPSRMQVAKWTGGDSMEADSDESVSGSAVISALTAQSVSVSETPAFSLHPFIRAILPDLHAARSSAIETDLHAAETRVIPLRADLPLQQRDGSAEHEYELRDRVGHGHFGELWRARRVDFTGDRLYVLKRLFVERGYATRLSGVREIHFGLKLRGLPSHLRRHVARLVEWWHEEGELWLAFRDEGESLSHWMAHPSSHHASDIMVTQSEQWTRMKVESGGLSSTDTDTSAAADNDDSAFDRNTDAVANFAPSSASVHGPFLPSPSPSTMCLREQPAISMRLQDSALALRKAPEMALQPNSPRAVMHSAGTLSSSASSLSSSGTPLRPLLTASSASRLHAAPHVWTDMQSILFQLLEALAVMHAHGITHRDVSQPIREGQQIVRGCAILS